MAPILLTKTDFKIARECPTKLYYFKKKYKSTLQSNEYLEYLKEGGHIIGAMAQVVHTDGIFIGLREGVEIAIARTIEALKSENATLFEAVFVHNGMLAAVDILEKRGSHLNIIEVKSKSFDSSEQDQIIGKKGGIKSEWLEYIEDVAFQKLVVGNSQPHFSIASYLLLPDKSKTTQIEGLASQFRLENLGSNENPVYNVKFLGDSEKLIESNFLTRVNIQDAVNFIFPLVQQEANRFVTLLNPQLVREQYHLGKHCKDCEFNTDDPDSGYRECWKDLANVKPHIFELYCGGAIKVDGKALFDVMISQNKVSLFDIPASAIKGKRGERQSIQIQHTQQNSEWSKPGFGLLLKSFKYPLHFIDFETSTSAVPYHKGMRPYEQIAFQWSCHTIDRPGENPKHADWINLEESFPSFEFAETLRKHLSPDGTIFMWADHENKVLKDVRRQALQYDYKNRDSLCAWIDDVIVEDGRTGRLVDMNRLCLENYFHPAMKGKTSIKYVLPAIWNNNEYLWKVPFLKDYFLRDAAGTVLNPYEVLPGIEIAGANQVIKAGTAAMSAYQEMMYGFSSEDSAIKNKWSELLLQYCKLDTTAMIIVWLHWNKIAS